MFQIRLIKADTGKPVANKKLSTSFNKLFSFSGKTYYTDNNGVATIPESDEISSLYTEIDGMYCQLYEGKFKGFRELNI